MFKLKTIHAKFIISVLAIALVLTLAIMGFIYFMVGNMLTEEVYGRITATVGYSAQQIDNWFVERRSHVDATYLIFHLFPDEETRLEALVDSRNGKPSCHSNFTSLCRRTFT